MFCVNCGGKLEENAAFCGACGTPIGKSENNTNQNMYSNVNSDNVAMGNASMQESMQIKIFKNSLGNKEMTSGIIWICIGGLQVLCSVFGFWYLIFVGIWNIVMGIMRINYKSQLQNKNLVAIYNDYSGQMTSIIVCLVVNLLFGGLIGIAGAIYDLVVRNYVMENVNILRNN